MPAFQDLSGQRFERLLVIRRVVTQRTKTNGAYFLCVCDCGNITSVRSGNLTRRNTKSCGCLKEEQRIHPTGWADPAVANPRRRELYAQKRAMGWKYIQNSPEHRAQKKAYHQKRMEEDPEKMRMLQRQAGKRNREKYPEKVVADNLKFRTKNPEYAHNHQLAHPEIYRVATQRRLAKYREAPQNDFTAAQWIEMKIAARYRCAYCGRETKDLEMDHITPLSKGGSHTASNIVPACGPCNLKKHAGPILKSIQPVLLLGAPSKKKRT